MLWKKRKLREKEEKLAKDEEKKRQDYKAGKQVGVSNSVTNTAVIMVRFTLGSQFKQNFCIPSLDIRT